MQVQFFQASRVMILVHQKPLRYAALRQVKDRDIDASRDPRLRQTETMRAASGKNNDRSAQGRHDGHFAIT
jgi:hypothetical protein